MGATHEGRSQLSSIFRMCSPVANADEAEQLALLVTMSLDTMAMGNFPYPSTYLSDSPDVPLPAWPVRAACTAMDVAASDDEDDASLLEGLRDAASVGRIAHAKA